MAKKSSGSFSFYDLTTKMASIVPEGAIIGESEFGKIDDWISTGNYALNALISGDMFKGIPAGRIFMLAGESQTGKTFLALNICREAQLKGYNIIYIDTESAIELEGIQKFGIDPNRMLYVPLGITSEVSTYLANIGTSLLEQKNAGNEIPKILVVIDSLGNLSTDKEVNDVMSGSDKADFTKPKELRRLFRVCTKTLGMLKIPVVVTNHVYASIGSFIPMNTTSGGGGPAFNASITLNLTKAKLKESSGEQTGIIVTCNLAKGRFTRAGIPIKFHISFYKGMNPFTGLESYLDYETCGVGPGKINKITTGSGKDKTASLEYVEDNSDKPKYYAARHLGKNIKPKELFRPEIFTREVLEAINPIMQAIFEFPDYTANDDLEEYAGDDDSEDINDALGIDEVNI